MTCDNLTRKYTVKRFGLFQNICIDAIYMPETKRGNKYILVFIDSFSRYIKLYCLPDLTAAKAAECLLDFICQFGIPLAMTMDNASQFRGEFEEVLKVASIEPMKIQPYSHEENSIVERANKEIERHIRDIVFDNMIIEEWDVVIPLTSRILNSYIHQDIGLSATDIVFAGQVNLMSGILQPHDKINEQSMSTYVNKLITYQQKIIEIVETKQNTINAKHINTDKGKRLTEFKNNSFVMAKYEINDGKPPTKLHPLLRGPYKVITRFKRTEGDIYTVQDLVTNKLYDFHVKLLQPYHYDATRTNPIDTALRDYPTQETEMTIIEKIIKHKFHPKENHARNLQLLVKWQGSEEPEWTKYTEKTIKKVAKVHDYLYENKLGSFVPQKFKRTIKVQKRKIAEDLQQENSTVGYYLRANKRRNILRK